MALVPLVRGTDTAVGHPGRMPSRSLAALETSAASVLARLRGEGPRPVVDPGLAGGLRDWFEVGLAEALSELPPVEEPVRVTKERLNQVMVCELHLAATAAAPRVITCELARGSLVDALFRQWVTVGQLDDPLIDALTALEAAGDQDEVVAYVMGLPTDERRQLVAEVAEHAASITAAWQVPSDAWYPRTQERIEVPLAGGRVVLAGVADLLLGGPAGQRASVCVVEVKSGGRRVEHRSDQLFYALLETLRSGAPPFQVATYYTRTGDLDLEAVDAGVLTDVLARVLEGAVRLTRLAVGVAPSPTPNPLCAWCVGLPRCEPGQGRAGSSIPRRGGRWDGDDVDCAAGDDRAPHVVVR